MGCTYDIFNARFKNEKYKKDFMDLWNSVLKDDLYDNWAHASEKNFSIDEVTGEVVFAIDSEPLFTMMYNGEQLEPFLVEFLKKHPDIELHADYECTFNNCGDMVLKFYEYYGDNILKIKTYQSDAPYICECEECGYEDDGEDLFTMHDLVNGTEMKCPNCGAEFEIDAYIEEEKINIFR